MAFFKIIYLFLIGTFSINVISYNPMLTYIIRVVKMSAVPNITGNYTIDNYQGRYYINADVTFDTDKKINKVIAVFERCAPEGINCEYFQSWTVTDICPKLLDQNQIWSSWYSRAFHPPVVCPIVTGIYQIRNGTIDLQPIVKIYTDATNYYWKVTQKFYDGNIFVGSYKMEATFLGYRKRNKHP